MTLEEKFHLAYATDAGYLIPTFVAAASALTWAGAGREKLVVHILDVAIPDEKWWWFEGRLRHLFGESFGLVRHQIEESKLLGFKRWHGSVAAYARLLLPELLPNVKWCFYGDGDTLFTGNPLALREYCQDRFALIGHRDIYTNIQVEWFAAHGYVFDPDEYVCSGFLLMNLEAFRDERLGAKCFDFINQHEDVVYPDQDALNVVCHGKILQLRNKWGEFGFRFGSINQPGCIHYGSWQPWKLEYVAHRGMLDIDLLWFLFAKRICGLPTHRLTLGKSVLVYWWLYICAGYFRCQAIILSVVPGLRGKVGKALSQMIRRKDFSLFLHKCQTGLLLGVGRGR